MKQKTGWSSLSKIILVSIALSVAITLIFVLYICQPALLTGQVSANKAGNAQGVSGLSILIYPAEKCQPIISAWIQTNAGKLHSKRTYGDTVAGLRNSLSGMAVGQTMTKGNGEYSVNLPVSDYEMIAEINNSNAKILWVQYIHLQPGKNRLDFNQANAATVLNPG